MVVSEEKLERLHGIAAFILTLGYSQDCCVINAFAILTDKRIHVFFSERSLRFNCKKLTFGRKKGDSGRPISQHSQDASLDSGENMKQGSMHTCHRPQGTHTTSAFSFFANSK